MPSIAQRLANLAEGLTTDGVISQAKGGTGTTTGTAGGYVSLSMPGAITPPFTGTARFYPPANITITKVLANLGTAPASGSFSFVINKNVTSIGTTCRLSSALITPV